MSFAHLFKRSTDELFVLEKCFHSISFKESKAADLIKEPPPNHLDLLTLTQNHLVRVYPGSTRQDSSNLHPLFYWTYGAIIVFRSQWIICFVFL